jgi:peroxiredoxin
MAQLRQDYNQFGSRDTEVIVIGPEGQSQFQSYWERNNLPFTGLPDPNASVLNRYGQEVNLFKLGRMPAQLVVDKRGMVRFIHYGSSMSDIPTTKEMIQLLDELNQESWENPQPQPNDRAGG